MRPLVAGMRRCFFFRSTVSLVASVIVNWVVGSRSGLPLAIAAWLACHRQNVNAQHTNAQCRRIA